MAKLLKILLPIALLQATSGGKPKPDLYTSAAFDIIGTDLIKDVFRVYRAKTAKLPPPPIPNLERKFKFDPVHGNITINATQGSLVGAIKLVGTEKANMSFDSEANIIYGTFPVVIDGMNITFKSFFIKFGELRDKGSVSMVPKSSLFELKFGVAHIPAGEERCFVTLLSTKTIDMKDFNVTATGFGSPAINRDMNHIIAKLMKGDVLRTYMYDVLEAYAADTAPHVFRYCKYLAPDSFSVSVPRVSVPRVTRVYPQHAV